MHREGNATGDASTTEAHSAVVTSSDGVRIHYDVCGMGSPALVFVHGWCCSRRHWDKQISHFANRHTLVTIDLAGHGESGRNRTKWTMRAFGEDVQAVVEELAAEQYILIGHSMGGSVILEAARRTAKPPIGMIGVDTWRSVGQVASTEEIAQFIAPFRADFARAARAFASNWFLPTTPQALVDQIVNSVCSAPSTIAAGALEELRAYGREMQEALQEINCLKVLINSVYRSTDVGAAQRFDIDVHFVSGAGHFLMLEAPHVFNQVLADAVTGFAQRAGKTGRGASAQA